MGLEVMSETNYQKHLEKRVKEMRERMVKSKLDKIKKKKGVKD